jgi:threonine/homoserine/homoserine lactone efflux protein
VTTNVITPVFLLASAAVAISPGPDVLFVLAKGISAGRRSALIAAAGFASGLSVHTTMAVVGLSALLMASALAFTIVKIAGGAYLTYLGIKAFRSGGLVSMPKSAERTPGPNIFARAFLMNVLNPKVAIFFLAFLPQFTRRTEGQLSIQLMFLGAAFALVALVIFSLVGVFSAAIGTWLRSKPKGVKIFDYVIGSLFICLGLRLALGNNR